MSVGSDQQAAEEHQQRGEDSEYNRRVFQDSAFPTPELASLPSSYVTFMLASDPGNSEQHHAEFPAFISVCQEQFLARQGEGINHEQAPSFGDSPDLRNDSSSSVNVDFFFGSASWDRPGSRSSLNNSEIGMGGIASSSNVSFDNDSSYYSLNFSRNESDNRLAMDATTDSIANLDSPLANEDSRDSGFGITHYSHDGATLTNDSTAENDSCDPMPDVGNDRE